MAKTHILPITVGQFKKKIKVKYDAALFAVGGLFKGFHPNLMI